MTKSLKSWIAGVFVVLAAATAPAAERAPFRQEELDQMLAPVALYPDPLLFQVLAASTRPLEVVHAARWSRANPGLRGQDAVRAVEATDWAPSVKALVAFPQVLAMLDGNLGWMERLGIAYGTQQADVMDTVQGLRRRAEAAGNLRSSPQAEVARQGDVIYIEPPATGVVYVPQYDPVVVYSPAPRPPLVWGSGIVFSTTWFVSRPDWHRRHAVVHSAPHRPHVHPRPHVVHPQPHVVHRPHVERRPHVEHRRPAATHVTRPAAPPAPRAHVHTAPRAHAAPAPRPAASAAPAPRVAGGGESRDRGVRRRD